MTTAFVTGISGLLGTNLAHDLLRHGYQVTGLLRDRSKYKGMLHDNLELVEGGLGMDMDHVLQGVDVIVHVAAETRPELTNYSDYLQVNFQATADLYDAAVQCGIKKFVFVSTANTLGFGSLNDLGNEEKQIMDPFKSSYYVQSKLEAENYVLKNESKMETVVVHPTFMIGAYDTKPSSGRIVLMGLKKKILFYPPGGKNFVHVRDVSQGIIKVLERAGNGKKYLLANENLSYLEFFKKLNRVTGQDPLMVRIPGAVLLTLGFFGDFLRFLKIRTAISSTNMRILCVKNFYTNHKSIMELGMEYRPLDEAIEEAVAYFTRTGKI